MYVHNGIDDDGDGLIDADDPDCPAIEPQGEICGNGLDDDGDGDIDFLDDDCPCGAGGAIEQNLIVNPSFEEFACIPENHSQMNCIGTSEDVGMGTADYFHTDGYYPEIFPAPLTGDGIIGGTGYNSMDLGFLLDNTLYQESFTLELTDDLEGGEDYIFTFSSAQFEIMDEDDEAFQLCNSPDFESLTPYGAPFEIVLYGYATIPPVPYFNAFQPAWQCPIDLDPMWIELGSVQFELDNNWQQYSIDLTVPAGGISTLAVGWPCEFPTVFDISNNTQCTPYFIFDDVSIGVSTGGAMVFNGEVELTETGSFCTEDMVISANADFVAATYTWYDNGDIIPGADASTLNLSILGLDIGTYSVLAEGVSGCATEEIEIVDAGLNNVVLLEDDQLICGASSYTIQANSLTQANLTYNWDTTNGNIVSGQGTLEVEVDQSGTYTLTSSIGVCEINQSIDIAFSELAPPVAQFSFGTELDCDLTTLELIDESQSTEGFSAHSWSVSDNGIYNGVNPIIQIAQAGQYEVNLEVTDNQGCSDDTTMIVPIAIHIQPTADFQFALNQEALSLDLEDLSLGSVDFWQWDLGDGYFSNDQHPSHIYYEGGEYQISLTVTDSIGCSDLIGGVIRLKEPVLVYAPNAFTPDGDGVNDQWRWSLNGVSEVEVLVWDRWGQEIFKSSELNGRWTGAVI